MNKFVAGLFLCFGYEPLEHLGSHAVLPELRDDPDGVDVHCVTDAEEGLLPPRPSQVPFRWGDIEHHHSHYDF